MFMIHLCLGPLESTDEPIAWGHHPGLMLLYCAHSIRKFYYRGFSTSSSGLRFCLCLTTAYVSDEQKQCMPKPEGICKKPWRKGHILCVCVCVPLCIYVPRLWRSPEMPEDGICDTVYLWYCCELSGMDTENGIRAIHKGSQFFKSLDHFPRYITTLV